MPVKAYIQSGIFLFLTAVALFGSAGTIAIPAFWIYLAIFAAVFVSAFLWLDPDLLRERSRPGGQRPPLALRLFSAVLFLHWIVAGLDRGRFHLERQCPTVAASARRGGADRRLWTGVLGHDREPVFSSVVRIQTDRGHVVVTSGPYAVIRHPGYTAGIIIMVASGIALGSGLSALVLIVLSVPFLLYRVITEDRVLRAELPGYSDYAARVRWRLFPGLW
jgi:hypothetical protein